MKYKVYTVSCPDYDHAPAAIARLLEEMGGMSSFAHPGETLLLKVNLLSGSRPEQAVTPWWRPWQNRSPDPGPPLSLPTAPAPAALTRRAACGASMTSAA